MSLRSGTFRRVTSSRIPCTCSLKLISIRFDRSLERAMEKGLSAHAVNPSDTASNAMIHSCLLSKLRATYDVEQKDKCAQMRARCIRRFNVMHRGFTRDDKRPHHNRHAGFLSRVEIICNTLACRYCT